MEINELIAVICFGMTCFSLGVPYGKDHKKKK